MKILITAANSANAYNLKNKLNSADIISGDYFDLPAFMLKQGKLIQLPNPVSISYVHLMLTLCLDQQINTVYALREEEFSVLNNSKQLFEEYGIEIVKG